MKRVARPLGWFMFFTFLCLPVTSWTQSSAPSHTAASDQERLEKWQRMKDSEKQELRERFQKWKNLTAEEKEELSRNREAWRKASPEERAAIRKNFETWQRLKQTERQQ